MKIPFTGGCMCGAVRYECSAEPVFMGNCHCRNCQRVTGTAFAAVILVPRNAVTITGDVKYYETTGIAGASSIVASAQFAVLNYLARCLNSWASQQAALMTQAGFNLSWIFTQPVLNIGIT